MDNNTNDSSLQSSHKARVKYFLLFFLLHRCEQLPQGFSFYSAEGVRCDAAALMVW